MKNSNWLSTSFFWLLTLLIIIPTIVFVFQLQTTIPIINLAISFVCFAGWLFLLLRQPQASSQQVILFSEREKSIIAYHEVGHALVAHMLSNTDPVHKVSILPHGLACGFTMLLPTERRSLWSKAQFEDMLAYALGGRAAELLIFGEVTTRASHDIEHATKIARSMITEYGMSERFGPIALGQKEELPLPGRTISEQRNYSEQTAREIDEEVRAIIQTAFDKAHHILVQNKTLLIMISERLIQEETLEGPAFEALFNQRHDEDQYEGPSVVAGMPDSKPAHGRGQLQLPMPEATYRIPPQSQESHSDKNNA